MNLSELKRRSPAELLEYAEELGIENASTLRKPDLVFATLKRLAESGVPIYGEGVLEILQDGFGFLRTPDVNYLAGPRRHLRLAEPDPALRPAHRRPRRRRGPRAEGGRALFRPAQGQHDQLRPARAGAPPGPLRQPHALLPDREADPRGRGGAHQGRQLPGDRSGGAARQGPARADRRPAAHRQDDADAEHRPQHRRQPPRGVPDRAADRRAAGRGHRHGAHGQGRGRELDLRRARLAPRPGRRDGQREGQAPGRARPRRGDPAGFDHPPRARLQHRGAVLGQGPDRRRRRQRACSGRSASSAPRATSRTAAA